MLHHDGDAGDDACVAPANFATAALARDWFLAGDKNKTKRCIRCLEPQLLCLRGFLFPSIERNLKLSGRVIPRSPVCNDSFAWHSPARRKSGAVSSIAIERVIRQQVFRLNEAVAWQRVTRHKGTGSRAGNAATVYQNGRHRSWIITVKMCVSEGTRDDAASAWPLLKGVVARRA